MVTQHFEQPSKQKQKQQNSGLMPREKMMQATSAGELENKDLLAILLKTGAAGCNVEDLSRRLMVSFRNVGEFVRTARNWRALREHITKHNCGVVKDYCNGVDELVNKKIEDKEVAEEIIRKIQEPVRRSRTVRKGKEKLGVITDEYQASMESAETDDLKTYTTSLPVSLPVELFTDERVPRVLREQLVRKLEDAKGKIVKGIGKVKLLELEAAMELGSRGFAQIPETKKEEMPVGKGGASKGGTEVELCCDPPGKVRTPNDAFYYFREALKGLENQENFLVLAVNVRMQPLGDPIVVGRGSISSLPVHPREVFREAIKWGAHAIFVAHNHPSGDPQPSTEDIHLTKRLVEVSKSIAIPLLDHLVIGSNEIVTDRYLSIRARNLVEF